MNYKYLQYTFYIYYAVCILHLVASILSILFPTIPKYPDSSGLGTLFPFFFLNLCVYFLVCGLLGFVIMFQKGQCLPRFLQILLATTAFVCVLVFFSFFYLFFSSFSASFVSSLTAESMPFLWGGLIGANIVIIIQFFIFEYLRN